MKATRFLVLLAIPFTLSSAGARSPRPCNDAGPPDIWTVKSPYPFQAGSERTYDELYHGPWKARVDIDLYAQPRSHRLIGTIKAGTVVNALIGESIVDHPFRMVARQDFKVVTESSRNKTKLATVRKGDPFWVLDLIDEGGFVIWWRCTTAGWDSTEPSDVDDNAILPLGTNQEGWVKIRDPKTGLTGWFKDHSEDDPKLIPARPTTKSTG